MALGQLVDAQVVAVLLAPPPSLVSKRAIDGHSRGRRGRRVGAAGRDQKRDRVHEQEH